MSSEWVFRKLVLPLSSAHLDSDLVEKMLATKGAFKRWVASIPEHIAAAEVTIKKEQEAKEEARRRRDREAAEALLIKDETAPIEDLDLTVRTYNSLKRAEIHTVQDILHRGRSNEETRVIVHGLGSGRPEDSLYRRLTDGGIAEGRIPAWIPRS